MTTHQNLSEHLHIELIHDDDWDEIDEQQREEDIFYDYFIERYGEKRSDRWLYIKPGASFFIPKNYYGLISNDEMKYLVDAVKEYHELYLINEDFIILYPAKYDLMPDGITLNLKAPLED